MVLFDILFYLRSKKFRENKTGFQAESAHNVHLNASVSLSICYLKHRNSKIECFEKNDTKVTKLHKKIPR